MRGGSTVMYLCLTIFKKNSWFLKISAKNIFPFKLCCQRAVKAILFFCVTLQNINASVPKATIVLYYLLVSIRQTHVELHREYQSLVLAKAKHQVPLQSHWTGWKDPYSLDSSRGHCQSNLHLCERCLEFWHCHVGGVFIWRQALWRYVQSGGKKERRNRDCQSNHPLNKQIPWKGKMVWLGLHFFCSVINRLFCWMNCC